MSKLPALAVLTTVALLMTLFPARLFAQEESEVQLGIAPLEFPGQYFDIAMGPGETRDFKVELSNHGPAPITARTYAANVYTVINGGFGASLDGEPTGGTTSWLDYRAEAIDLPPGMAVQRSFTVTVPPGTNPGEYITSLVVQNADPVVSAGGSVAVEEVQRKAIAVAIAVGDPLPPRPAVDSGEGAAGEQAAFVRQPELLIGEADHLYLASSSIVSFALTNAGNVHLRPSGELLLLDDAGQEVSRTNVVMDTFYAVSATRIEVPFTTALPPGTYTVRLKLDYEGRTAEAARTLHVPRPTEAESQGAPTGGDRPASEDQLSGSGVESLLLVVGLGAAGAVATMCLYTVARRRLHARRRDPASPQRG